jgi:hypothetical protein
MYDITRPYSYANSGRLSSPLSPYYLFNILSNAIQVGDHSVPHGCGLVIINCVTSLLSLPYIQLKPAMYNHPYHLAQVMRFLATPRTEDDVKILEEKIGTCCCATASPLDGTLQNGLHNTFPDAENINADFVMSRLCLLINSHLFSLTNLHNRATQEMTSSRGTRVQGFPVKMDDLFPFGLFESIKALARWACREMRAVKEKFELLHLLEYLVRYKHSYICPALATVPEIFQASLDQISDACTEFENRTMDSAKVTLEQIQAFQTQYAGAFDFLHAVQQTSFQEEYLSLINVWSGDRESTYSRLHAIATIARKTGNYLTISVHSNPVAAESLFPVILGVGSWLESQRLITSTTSEVLSGVIADLGAVLSDLRAFGYGGRCAAPECDKTRTSENRKFARCRGCSELAYCSKNCQQSAWRHGSISHKQVCNHIVQLNTYVNGVYPGQGISSRVDYKLNGLHEMDMICQVLLKCGRGLEISESGDFEQSGLGTTLALIRAHLFELKAAKLRFLCEYIPPMMHQVIC